jgi:transcriptional antiterminator NusG
MKSPARKIYRLGDRVRIMTGPFAAFTGKVEGINQSKTLLKVRVDIFGRPTPVKVLFSEAEKVEFDRPLPPPSTPN